MPSKGRIDVHHHVLPEFYKEVQRSAGITGSAYRGFPEWSPESSLALMDKLGLRSGKAVTAKVQAAMEAEFITDAGAYAYLSPLVLLYSMVHSSGPYQIPNVRAEAHLVYTNHQPSGSVRAPTAPQANWASEMHMDSLAQAIGMDPVEFRLKHARNDRDIAVIKAAADKAGWKPRATPNNKPGGSGVSVNTYNQFDVQKAGAILNNSATMVQTQLGGWINGNAYHGFQNYLGTVGSITNIEKPRRGFIRTTFTERGGRSIFM